MSAHTFPDDDVCWQEEPCSGFGKMWIYQVLKASDNDSHFPHKIDSWEHDRSVGSHTGLIPALVNLWAKPMTVPELSTGYPRDVQFWNRM